MQCAHENELLGGNRIFIECFSSFAYVKVEGEEEEAAVEHLPSFILPFSLSFAVLFLLFFRKETRQHSQREREQQLSPAAPTFSTFIVINYAVSFQKHFSRITKRGERNITTEDDDDQLETLLLLF